MPQGVAARALLGVIALITIIALAVVPVVDARPKDKKNGGETTTEVSSDASGDTVSDETASQTTSNGADERTLLSSDADGDYIPDSLDNCPNVQNPDQSDSDGDGVGDSCPIYYDTDGDGVPDKEDNCLGVSTTDFRDTDGDGVGDPCDKSPDGVEPEPVQVADYVDQGEPAEADPETVNGANQDGQSVERDGKSRSRQRSRTETSDPIITTGSDGAETADGVSAGDGEAVADPDADYEGVGSEGQVITEGPDAVPYEPSGRDNPRRNEELIAEAAASGELYAEPEPPPAAQRAWDEAVSSGEWRVVARIDSGANVAEAEQSASAADTANGDRDARQTRDKKKRDKGNKEKKNTSGQRNQRGADVEDGDAEFARGWALAAVRLQEETDPGDGEPGDEGGVSPVPVESGLVIGGDPSPQSGSEPVPGVTADETSEASGSSTQVSTERSSKKRDSDKKDGSRRNGSSRAAAAPSSRATSNAGLSEKKARASDQNDKKANKKNANRSAKAKERKRERTAKARQKTERRTGAQESWTGDRYFDGGLAGDYQDVFEVAGTDDQELYLTTRAGDGPGKKRGFNYAIPVNHEGSYLVRFYFMEPDVVSAGARVFSVAAEGDDLVDALDLAAEAGVGTALVKQAEVRIDDGTLDLEFMASEGAPIISAIEVLEPAK